MTEVISVRFRSGCKTYYFDPRGLEIRSGDQVIVETASGTEFVTCCEGNHMVDDRAVVQPLRAVVRIATDNDRRTDQLNRQREKEAFAVCEKKIAAHKLEMKLIRVESNFEGSKIIFFFTAEGRVDFRELVKDLATAFRSRIELRQVGVRDEAKMLGGLGICGRPLCCSQFLEEFIPVSIKMAKTQNLSLTPSKISGTCGRLMCCLKYEQNAYEDAVKRMPKNDSFVNTPDGPGNVCSVDLLREEVKVRLDESPETPRLYKGCELQILRNGKGSREGIEIPKERPARFIRPREEEEETAEAFSAPFARQSLDAAFPQLDSGEGEEKKKSRRRPRRRGGQEKAKSAPKTEGGKTEVKVERIPVKVSGDLTAEKKAAADRKVRGERGEKGERRMAKVKAAAPQQPKAPQGEKAAEGEQAKAAHRRRRPRRRRSGGEGGGSAAPKES